MNRRSFLLLAAATPFAARAEVALADRPPLALVTCDTEGRIAVVDVGRGRVVTSIPVSAAPHSIERAGGAAVVCHTNTGVVTIVDGTRLEVRHVLDGFAEPRYTAAHPDGRHAFVTDSGSREVVSLDLARGRVVGRVRLGEWPRHLTLDSTGRTLWVGLGNESERLAIVDLSDASRPRLRDGRELRTTCVPIGSYNVETGFGRVLTPSLGGGTLSILDRRGALLHEVDVAASCHDACPA